MRLYDHPASGNCMKARIALRQLEIPYEAETVDLFRRETRTPEHMARNPDGRVPVLELDSGRTIPESGAILLYLADGTHLLPDDRLERATVHQWLFFEQNQIESQLAVARFLVLTGRAERYPELTETLVARGRGSLATLARGLADERPFVCGDDYTVADIALYAYVHCAHDAGVDAREQGPIGAWLDRVEATPGFENDLAPFPPHAVVAS
ncbi:MAG TPA: glutathione S-transferase family protein [Solirubrobacteraceae bacterium]|nr:glutathione S-transferase family protein [Solirubrobacteraceae bacterium]